MPDIAPSQAVIDIVLAIIVAVFAYGATSLIALRRDRRRGKADDVSLFNQVRIAAAEQMVEMRSEVADLRTRVDKAEQASERDRRNFIRMRSIFREALDHMERLESTLKSQGLHVPDRPQVLGANVDDLFEV